MKLKIIFILFLVSNKIYSQEKVGINNLYFEGKVAYTILIIKDLREFLKIKRKMVI